MPRHHRDPLVLKLFLCCGTNSSRRGEEQGAQAGSGSGVRAALRRPVGGGELRGVAGESALVVAGEGLGPARGSLVQCF